MGWITNGSFIFQGLQHWTSNGFNRACKTFDDTLLTVDLRGRVVVVTGANQGLGLGISHALAERGCTLYMVCRDEDRGKAAVKSVQTATGNKDVNLKICNLSSKQAIQALANDLTSKSIRIYLLIHNAGIMVNNECVSPDGHEINFAVNTLAPFMLTTLLRGCLKLGGPGSKVVMVSSGGAYTAPLVVEGADRPPAAIDGITRYAHDKRRQIAMAERFADVLAVDGIGAYSYHPGWVDTPGLQGSMPGFYKTFKGQLRSVEQGADTAVFLATCPSEQLVSGAFYLDRRQQSKHLFWAGTQYEPHHVDALWKFLEATAGIPETA